MRVTGDEFLALLDAPAKPVKLGYVFREGVHSLSYSRLGTFYSCPRKFNIGELRGARGFAPTIDTAYGHAYGAGVQTFMRYAEEGNLEVAKQRAVVAAIAAYDYSDIFAEKSTTKKSLWYAVIAVEQFCSQVAPQILSEFKIAIINGKPAIEIFFLIQITEEYDYQGHIDLVLEHRVTGELFVLEIKTSAGEAQPADWQNSFQTLGYNVVIHAHSPSANFNVLYLCYNTKTQEHRSMSFTKSCAHRAEFLTTLMQDVEVMEMYRANDFWPKRGNACSAWGKPCYLFGVCDSDIAAQPEVNSYEALKMDEVDIYLTMEQLLAVEQTTDVINWDEVNV